MGESKFITTFVKNPAIKRLLELFNKKVTAIIILIRGKVIPFIYKEVRESKEHNSLSSSNLAWNELIPCQYQANCNVLYVNAN